MIILLLIIVCLCFSTNLIVTLSCLYEFLNFGLKSHSSSFMINLLGTLSPHILEVVCQGFSNLATPLGLSFKTKRSNKPIPICIFHFWCICFLLFIQGLLHMFNAWGYVYSHSWSCLLKTLNIVLSFKIIKVVIS